MRIDSKFYKEVEGICRLKVPFENIYTSVFLIQGNEKLFLVDCATTDSDVEGFIIPALKKINYTPEDIGGIILTHKHSDHAGGIHRFLSLAPDTEVITDIRELCKGIFTYPLSGHTKDCIGIHDTRTHTLISGDGLQGAGVDKYRCYTQDREAYIETVRRIQKDSTIENILFSHAYEPWNKNSVFGRENVCDCLKKCIECIGEKL